MSEENDMPVRGGNCAVEQRMAMREGVRNVRETRRCPLEFELRDVPNGTGGADLLFTGYASVTNQAYEMQDLAGEFNEEVCSGAFRKTIDEGCDTTFLLNHEGMTLARTKSGTLRLAEHSSGTPTGLHAEARLDPKNPTVAAIRSAIERGDLDEMSFAFRVTRQRWDWATAETDVDHRYIQEVNLNQGDVSLTNFGANGHTAGHVAIRSKSSEEDWREAFELFAEFRAGNAPAETLTKLNRMAVHLGDAGTVLQELISTVDPDQSGAAGNSETESSGVLLEQRLAEASAIAALGRARRKAA